MTQDNQKKIELTKESLASLQEELEDLETNQLPEVIKRIAKAREQGDLSENSEYKDAKDQQELLQVRIEEIKTIVASAKIIKEKSGSSTISVGSKVTLKSAEGKQAYEVVGEFDKAAALENTVSAVSPLGKVLIGKKTGDKIVVEVPAGKREFTIADVK